MGEFIYAAQMIEAGAIDRATCRKHALKYTTENVRFDYHAYFVRLMTLWGKGFYDLSPPFILPAITE